ncbi:MAG: class I SAM-dependent methyltransferase [Chloroflexi bacterium]|nr:class I SAM-dependent methyltransferase [Chloroflexota bacterium]
MPLNEYQAANLANWNDRVPIHWDSEDYRIQQFVSDPEYVSDAIRFDRERDELGDVAGKTLLHLQCHIGTDTLSWARSGATVTGVDFSEPAIDAASRLSSESGTPGEFVVAELDDSPNILPDRQFDIVYTGLGAICWLPDIKNWAKVVAHFLKPGGTFYIVEGHPMMWAVSDQDHGDQIVLDWPYFEAAGPLKFDEDKTYAGDGTIDHPTQYSFTHGLGETITALIEAGLQIEFVHEHRVLQWQAFPMLEPAGNGLWKMPKGRENHLPLMHSIRAHRSF